MSVPLNDGADLFNKVGVCVLFFLHICPFFFVGDKLDVFYCHDGCVVTHLNELIWPLRRMCLLLVVVVYP